MLPAQTSKQYHLSLAELPKRGRSLGAFQRGRSARQAKVSLALTFFAGFLVKQKTGTKAGKGSPILLSRFIA